MSRNYYGARKWRLGKSNEIWSFLNSRDTSDSPCPFALHQDKKNVRLKRSKFQRLQLHYNTLCPFSKVQFRMLRSKLQEQKTTRIKPHKNQKDAQHSQCPIKLIRLVLHLQIMSGLPAPPSSQAPSLSPLMFLQSSPASGPSLEFTSTQQLAFQACVLNSSSTHTCCLKLSTPPGKAAPSSGASEHATTCCKSALEHRTILARTIPTVH